MPPRVCVVGSANVDLTFRTARLPRPGETLAGTAFHLGFGGKGANQAAAAARLGASVSMVARVGADAFGEQLRANFHTFGIDTTFVLTDTTRPSGVAAITVDDAAQNCILVVPGANLGLSPDDVRAAASAIQAADVLLCQLEVPVETTAEALRLARAAGVRTILNPAPAQPLPDEVLKLADLCVPNETELELLADDGEALRRRGPGTVIVTLGERGALVVGEGAVPAPRVEAVDTAGAGDAFIGALAVFLVEGMPLREAVCWACAAASHSVTRLGTQSALPTRAVVEALRASKI